MQISKTALFGGALMAAGIAQTAAAQNFVFADSSVYYTASFSESVVRGVTDAGTGSQTISNDTSPGANLSQSYSYGGITGNVVQTNNQLRVDTTWDGTVGYTYFGNLVGYGGGFMISHFQVDQDAQIRLTWDFSGTDLFGTIILFDEDNVVDLIFDGAPLNAETGDITFDVFAGTNYRAVMAASAPYIFDANDTSFIQMDLIPAPGPAALAALGGLAALRRRR